MGADGVLVIDKPAGPTSHDVVARARRALGVDRVGHTGTLDPMATGVLPLVVGRATRLARFLSGDEKEYDAEVRLGADTDTGDAEGVPRPPAGPPAPAAPEAAGLTRPAIEAVLRAFVGSYDQVPPAFSAKKIQGVRAYVLARRGRPVEPRPVRVSVRALELAAFDGDRVRLRVTCSAGFYVRALARDLGRRLGTGGHLTALRRTRSGTFGQEVAVPLAAIEREGREAWRRLLPLEALLPHLPALVLTGEGTRRARQGANIGPAQLLPGRPAAAMPPAGAVRLLDEAGAFVAIAEPTPAPGVLHPVVVMV